MGRLKSAAARSLKRRWLLTVFLPVAVCVAVAAAGFALYAFFTLERGRMTAAAFALCAGAALILAFWLLGSAHLRYVTDSLAALTAFARRISDGSFGLKLDEPGADELGRLAEEINALSEEVARSGKLQTEFISSVSHELRTPLTAIGGWAETLGYDEAIRGESRRGVEIIARETGRLSKMVEELLEFTRIQDGRFRLNLERVDIAAEVEDAIFTYSRLFQQNNIALRYDGGAEELPAIEGDPERLRQVLLNLLDNAVKYGSEGGEIEVVLAREESRVRITVRDHGPGIPAAELPRVKEKFYKGSGKARGSGIGLAVCEEIVTRHGGKLTIENAPDGGVLATVLLPING
jgi:signal transduction histidine kinase